jgi:hypothetical protein
VHVAQTQQPDDHSERDVGGELRARDLGHVPTLGTDLLRKRRRW